MFDKCLKCERIGQDCVPNLLALSWPDLLSWWRKRQDFLGWTNKTLSEKSKIPEGTIARIKSGEDDARYSTMRNIIHALMGGYSVEFHCQKQLEQEFAHIETLEKQCRELTIENEGLVAKLLNSEEAHRNDILGIVAEYKEQLDLLKENNKFLREECKWQQEHMK